METYKYEISNFYMSALINGDYSDLDSHDTELVTDFQAWIIQEHGKGHWSHSDCGENYARCDISYLFSNVETIEWVTL